MGLFASANATGLAAVSAFSIAAGFLLLWVMWHFIFSSRNEHDDTRDKARRGEG